MATTRLGGALAAALLLAPLSACHEVHFEPRQGGGDIVIYDDLFSVEAPTEQHVVASGYWGAIYVSQDGGASWTRADTKTKKLVYDVAMTNDRVGWAVGQVGLVLRTEDGGKTWTEQHTPKDGQGVHLFAVAALDERRAWAVGEWGTRIYTDDGGATWQDHSLTIDSTHSQFVWLSIPDQERVRRGEPVFEDVGLGDVFCLPTNTNRCWIIGEFAYLFHTEDGGLNWEQGEILSGIQLEPLEFPYNKLDLAPEQEEKIREFARQIMDQQHLNVAIEPRVSDRELAEFGKESDPFPLFDIVEARTQAVVAVVEDEGIATDRVRRRGAPPWDFEDFLEDDPGFLKRYLESRRAAAPGVEVEIAQNPYLFTVRFADENEGYISGLGGVVLRSHDGGRSWRYEDVGRKMAIFSVAPFPDGRAFVVGEKGLMRVSRDGGESWEPLPGFPEIFTFIRDIKFHLDRKVGYAVGQRGLVLRTHDGGGTWQQVLPKVEQAMDIVSVGSGAPPPVRQASRVRAPLGS
jgi:photosystem II stability/assembly factor-like uncharacterized protein